MAGWSSYRLGSVQAKGAVDPYSDASVEEGRIKVVTVMAQETDPINETDSDRKVLVGAAS